MQDDKLPINEKGDISKCGVEYNNYGGATSFSELDMIEDMQEKNYEIRELLSKFSALGDNIIQSPFGNKKLALQSLAYEFYLKLEETMADEGEDEEEDVEKATWSAAFINDLPDSSFFLIEGGGKKDKDGKTEPRSLRHLPYKDASGKVDLPHLRNAIARAAQVKLKDGKTISADAAKAIQTKAQKILDSMKAEKIWMTGIEKAYDIEKRLVYGIVLNPDVVDSQGDIASADEIEKSAHEFFMKSRMLDHNHKVTLDPSIATPVESYIAPTDFLIGKKLVKKGAWVMVTKVFDNGLWEDVKKGKLLSYSIAGYGRRTETEIEE